MTDDVNTHTDTLNWQGGIYTRNKNS
jgi:hypothetical protein